jgi:hypothetical protein
VARPGAPPLMGAQRGPGVAAVDGGDLTLGGGLLALVRPLLDRLPEGGRLVVRSSSPSVGEDLVAWCRVEHHGYAGAEREAGGAAAHTVVRGPLGLPVVSNARGWPAHADRGTGFAPRGAAVEPGGPAYPFSLVDAAHAGPSAEALRALTAQARAGTWDADRDIPWDRVGALPAALAAAVGQVMTFLAENELAALYVPARFLPRLHPAYLETVTFLTTQLADEARHAEAFLRRAGEGGSALGISSATTGRSLLPLLETEDFTEASFLLTVLGEGTFLDLLRFVERHAPDEATAVLARRARADESRHVHFGVLHVRHAIDADPGAAARLEEAVRRRKTRLAGAGVPAPLQDALTILAAGGTAPAAVARGHRAFRALTEEMEEARRKRLVTAGFSADQAARLSVLHTPNFM